MDGDALRALGWVDLCALLVMALAVLRGLWIGIIREAFSLAAVALACVAIRFGTLPFSDWLLAQVPVELAPMATRLFAGIAIGIGTALVVGRIGALIRRGVRAAGLGLLDRLGGGLLGAGEGALVIALAMLAMSSVLGTDHPSVRDTRTLATLDAVASGLRGLPPDVAAPYPNDRS